MVILGIILLLMILVIIISIIVATINYIFMGLGLMEIGKSMGEKNSWLSWIPYANQYLLGKLGMNHTVGLILVIASGIISFLSFIAGMISGIINEGIMEELIIGYIGITFVIVMITIAIMVLYYISCHNIYKKFSDKAVIMTVFTVLTGGALAPVFLFAIRNNKLRE